MMVAAPGPVVPSRPQRPQYVIGACPCTGGISKCSAVRHVAECHSMAGQLVTPAAATVSHQLTYPWCMMCAVAVLVQCVAGAWQVSS
jgi:hypothetical protein